MKAAWLWSGGAALGLMSALAVAQEGPRSILPPVFQSPEPTPTATPQPSPSPRTTTPGGGATPPTNRQPGEIVQPLPATTDQPVGRSRAPAAPLPPDVLDRLPSLRELEGLSTSELDERLGLKPRFDIPPEAQRTADRAGVIGLEQGGLPSETLARQPAQLVRAALAGTRGPLVSRWGHIMLRRALSSRLASPAGMDPVEFVALRTGLLNRMGEVAAARALAQSVDTSKWNGALTGAAIDAYLGSADILGICPATNLQGSRGSGAQWEMLSAICSAFGGEATRGQADLERLRRRGTEPRIDVLLAQRFAAAAGTGRRGFNVEWDEAEEITLWRFASASALGEPIPEALANGMAPAYRRLSATLPMLAPLERARYASTAAEAGMLSSQAMVDLYSQIYAVGEQRDAGPAAVAVQLRQAYTANDPAARVAAIRGIWGEGRTDHGLQVLTAYAAARVTPSQQFADDAEPLLASMLAAGLDRNAVRWQGMVAEGSGAWALLALAAPSLNGTVNAGAVEDFISEDSSDGQRRSQFLVAGLAGLGRLSDAAQEDLGEQVRLDYTARTRWAQAIDRAARADNRGLVVLLAGLGMQGSSWERMTGRQLYQIVAALNAVGLNAEARMIAAEAVARS